MHEDLFHNNLRNDMTSKHSLCVGTLAGLAALLAQPALAQSASQSYYYGGLSVGESQTNQEDESMTRQQISPALSIVNIDRQDHHTAYKLFGGYQFNQYFALEGGFFYLGKPTFDATVFPAGTLHGQVEMRGWNLDLVGFMPISGGLSALARLGAQYAKASGSFSGTGSVTTVADPSPSEHQLNYKAGVGLQYEINPSVLVRGEFERYRVSDVLNNHNGVNVTSLSLVFPFGRTAAPVKQVAAAQPYVAAAPMVEAAPPPAAGVPEVAPMAPERRRVTYSAESLFGFDKSEVRPEGRAALDTFAKELDGTRFDMVNVEGHTDRLGTPEYNDKLSLQRADAVKAYLVDAGKVDASKVTAVGKGESTPVTHEEDCKGRKATPKLVACLQADRRVEIEVVGSR
jgi:OOP family OmpA-OmpF porin